MAASVIDTPGPNREQWARNGRIDEITPDFTLEDVWALPACGSGEDFGRLIDVMGSLDLANGRTVHAVMHLAWAEQGRGRFRDRWRCSSSRGAGSGRRTWR